MKTTISIQDVQPAKIKPSARKSHQILKRASPFHLLIIFLIILFPYAVVTATSILSARLIIIPFLIANVSLADFAIWNYFGGKQRLPVWISETVISAIILYWLS